MNICASKSAIVPNVRQLSNIIGENNRVILTVFYGVFIVYLGVALMIKYS